MAAVVGQGQGSAGAEAEAAHSPATKTLRIGTRSSDLAMVQTRHVESLLTAAFASLKVEVQEGVKASGDVQLDVSLASLAAKTPGLFTTELEVGLVNGQYDAVVHSLKDMPTTLPDGLVLAAITEREDPADALVVAAKHKGLGGLTKLPQGAVIGTSSIRREGMLRKLRPDLVMKLIRGNVNTRLRKLDDGEYDAIILAVAGLNRLGFQDRVEQVMLPPDFMYGVGQGALGLQCRADDADTIAILKVAEHADTAARCTAERALLRTLQGGCQVPLGVATSVEGDVLKLACTILKEDGSESVEMDCEGPKSDAEAIGEGLAKRLLTGRGKALMEHYKAGDAPRPLTYGSASVPQAPHVEARAQAALDSSSSSSDVPAVTEPAPAAQ